MLEYKAAPNINMCTTTISSPSGYSEKKLRELSKCNKNVDKVYTATDTRPFAAIPAENNSATAGLVSRYLLQTNVSLTCWRGVPYGEPYSYVWLYPRKMKSHLIFWLIRDNKPQVQTHCLYKDLAQEVSTLALESPLNSSYSDNNDIQNVKKHNI
jgi:hypothetical protein